MIEINLLPEDLRRRESAKIHLPDIPIKKTLFVAGGVVLALQAVLSGMAVYTSKIELAYLTHRTAEMRERTKEVRKLKTETKDAMDRIKEARAITKRPFFWSSLLDAVTQTATKGVWLRNLSVIDQEISEAAPPPAPGDKKKAAAKPKVTHEKFLLLSGAVVGAGQETAYIGKYLKELKSNAFFTELFSDIKASDIAQKRYGSYDAYEFTISCHFKKDKMP